MASKEVGYCHAARATSQSANLPIFLFSSLRCQWDRVPQGRSETPKANLATTRPVRMAAFSLPPRISDAEVRDRGKTRSPEAPRAAPPPGSSAKSIHAGTPPVTRAWLYPLAFSRVQCNSPDSAPPSGGHLTIYLTIHIYQPVVPRASCCGYLATPRCYVGWGISLYSPNIHVRHATRPRAVQFLLPS